MVSLKLYSPKHKYSVNKRKFFVASDLLWRAGVYPKEDKQRIYNNTPKILNQTHTKNIKELYNLATYTINKIVETNIRNTKRRGNFVYYRGPIDLTQKLLAKIKKEYLIFKRLSSNTIIDNPQYIVLPYINNKTDLFNPKPILYSENDNIFQHPRDKIKNIIGEKTKSDCNKIKQYKSIMTKKTLQSLILYKNQILKKIDSYCIHSTNDYDFIFSKKELQHIKLLALKYDVLNDLLESNGISTYNIETILYNKVARHIKQGDCLPNGDILIKNTNTYDKLNKRMLPSIITFANTTRGYRFKTYYFDLNYLGTIPNFQKQYVFYTKLGNKTAINLLNYKIAQYINNTNISEVYIETLDKKSMEDKLAESNFFTKNQILELLGDDKKFYYIKNLKNFNVNRFYNVSFPLIKCLKEFGAKNNINKAFLEAQAFNNIKHSPIFLYLKMGCKPLSHTEEELKEKLHKGVDYRENIWLMYER